jgi:hypothetical protein
MAKRLPISTLRRHLQVMTETTRNTHVATIEVLRRGASHSIEVLTNDNSPLAFNCVMYAFGIEHNARYIQLARLCLDLDPNDDQDPKYQGVHTDTGFVEFLIEKGLISEVMNGTKGDVAVYCSEGRVKHVGRVIGPSRVASKWGMGHEYAHALAEVPSNYGGTLRYFTGLSQEKTLRAFIAYAASKGITLDALL